jgi:predicted metal-dependent peptidase
MQNVIDDLLTEPKIPWQAVLRNQVKSVISNKLIHSIIQPNIALYPVMDEGIEPFPGYNRDFTFRITLCTDASGSVGDDAFRTFMGEHISILRQYQGVVLNVITFDHGIQYEETFTRTSSDAEINEVSKSLRTRRGYGGTEFCAPFRRVIGTDTAADWVIPRPDRKLPPTDLMVIFTDGFAPVADSDGGPMPRYKPPCMVIWVICKGGTVHPSMQNIVVRIND